MSNLNKKLPEIIRILFAFSAIILLSACATGGSQSTNHTINKCENVTTEGICLGAGDFKSITLKESKFSIPDFLASFSTEIYARQLSSRYQEQHIQNIIGRIHLDVSQDVGFFEEFNEEKFWKLAAARKVLGKSFDRQASIKTKLAMHYIIEERTKFDCIFAQKIFGPLLKRDNKRARPVFLQLIYCLPKNPTPEKYFDFFLEEVDQISRKPGAFF